jgi:hypothetical protein
MRCFENIPYDRDRDMRPPSHLYPFQQVNVVPVAVLPALVPSAKSRFNIGENK